MKTTVVTYADSGAAGWAKTSLPNKRRYCEAQGYSLSVHETPIDPNSAPSWQKIPWILKHLEDSDLVLWSDADALIMNFDLKVEDLIDDDFDLVLGSDANGVHCGNLIVRKSALTQKFFKWVWQLRYRSNPSYRLQGERNVVIELFDREFTNEPRIHVSRQQVLNSYPAFPCNRRTTGCRAEPAIYERGHFIIHFAGINSKKTRALAWFDYYSKRAGHHGEHTIAAIDARPVTHRNVAGRIQHATDTIVPPESNSLGSRGIVVTCVQHQIVNAWVSLRLLRIHGCQLPIQLWFLGDEKTQAKFDALFSQLDIECVDARRHQPNQPQRNLSTRELRAYALHHCSFSELLYLDSRNCSLRDPSYLFDCAQYKQRGALIWPGFQRTDPEDAMWDFISFRDEPRFDGAQLLIDKRRHGRLLAFNHWVNDNSDYFGRYFTVDEAALQFSFHRLGVEFEIIGRPPDALRGSNFHSHLATVQHDPDGHRIFQRRHAEDWQLYGPNPRAHGFELEERCSELLRELREQEPRTITTHVERNQPMGPRLVAAVSFPVTICVIAYGPHADIAEKFLKRLYDNTDPALFRLRVGLNEAEPRTHALVERAAAKFGNVETFVEPVNIFKNPLMRRMFYERPLETKWVIWFDDDSFPTQSDWLSKLAACMKQAPAVSQWGKKVATEYPAAGDVVRFISRATWYNHLPLLEGKKNTNGEFYRFHFVTGGFWAMRSDVIRHLDWPDPHLQQFAEDVFLGEALRQNGHQVGAYSQGITVNGAPRRNSEAEEIFTLPKEIWSRLEAESSHVVSSALASALSEVFSRARPVREYGCGTGFYCKMLEEMGFNAEGINATAPNGSCSFDKIVTADLTRPLKYPRSQGLCLEVAERIPHGDLDVFLDNLTRNSREVIVLSWGTPNQRGRGLVSCRTNDWVIERMKELKWHVDLQTGEFLRQRVEDHVWWLRETLMVFREEAP